MAETSLLRLPVDPDDWLDADLPTVVVDESGRGPSGLYLPPIRMLSGDVAYAGADQIGWPVEPVREFAPNLAANPPSDR